MPPLPPPKKIDTSDEGSGSIGYLALVLAWAVPGLGHLLLGERVRALIFGLTIHLLFGAGLLLGGLRSINPPEQPIWTYTQFLTGWPMLVVYRLERENSRQLVVNPIDNRHPPWSLLMKQYWDQRPKQPGPERETYARTFFAQHPQVTNHPKVQDIGAVYCGIAGMLNLLVMFDILLRITGSTREETGARKSTPATPARSVTSGEST